MSGKVESGDCTWNGKECDCCGNKKGAVHRENCHNNKEKNMPKMEPTATRSEGTSNE